MEFKYERKKQTATTRLNKSYYQKQEEDSPRINAIANNIFKKSFTITGNDKYVLPKPELMFIRNPWKVEELQKIKKDLNEIKSKLNNYYFTEWQQHTSQRNKAKDIEWRIRRDFDPEFVTQAWCKFHEIVSKYPLIPKEKIFANNNKFLTLHLCEAPGAFITCLNHYLKTNIPTIYWDWLAMTFNPYYEGNSNSKMISDDRFILYTLNNWFFGKDNTGNLMTLENLDALIDKSKLKGKVTLITADGSINCLNNPGEQEAIVVSIHFCEVVAAMYILETGGNFLLKIFTTFEHESVYLIYFLSCVFKKIHFYKPVTSKEGNSEVYTICLDFKGSEFISPYLPVLRKEYGKNSTTAMFDKDDIPESFIQQIISSAILFKNHQCEVIENNIRAFHSKYRNNYEVNKIAKLVADKYIVNFPLQKLHMDLQIVGNLRLKKNKSNHWVIQPTAESYNERQEKGVLEPIHRLLMYRDQLKLSEAILNISVFKPASLMFDVSINIGKPYERIQSSRFCSVQISEIFNLLFQAADMEKEKFIHLPMEKSLIDYENKIKEFWNDNYKTIYFEYTRIYSNEKIISSMKQVLINLQESDDLILFGFLLLTQFNVGLIYLLAHTFDYVEFATDNIVGCTIKFKNFKNKQLVLEKISSIQETAEAASDDATILSIIPISELYDSELYPIVLKLNNWIAKYCVNYIASIYNECQQQSPAEE